MSLKENFSNSVHVKKATKNIKRIVYEIFILKFLQLLCKLEKKIYYLKWKKYTV